MIFGEDVDSHQGVSEAVHADDELSLPASTSIELARTPATLWPDADLQDFPSRYLNTSYEHLNPSFASRGKQGQLAKKLAEMSMSQEGSPDLTEPHKGGRIAKTVSRSAATASTGGDGWSSEAYEVMRLSGVEEVFLAFQERLEASDSQEQIVRYEFKGTPLPFQAKSKPYKLLYSSNMPAGGWTVVGRSGHTSSDHQGVRRYDESCSQVDRCIHCQSPRTYEMQLMPNLVNLLERHLDAKAGEELGWATVWCFTCSADCLDASRDSQDNLDWQGWREEVAMVELED